MQTETQELLSQIKGKTPVPNPNGTTEHYRYTAAEHDDILSLLTYSDVCEHNWTSYDNWDIVPMVKCDHCGLYKEDA